MEKARRSGIRGRIDNSKHGIVVFGYLYAYNTIMPFKSSEAQRKYSKEYRAKLPKDKKNLYYQKWYAKNKELVLSRNKLWRKAANYRSPTNSCAYRKMVINLLRQRDGDICGHCNKLMENDFGVDHKLPLCIGGDDNAMNLRLVHKICNIRRERSSYIKK